MRGFLPGLGFLLTACWSQSPPSGSGIWAQADSVLQYAQPDSTLPFLRVAENRLFLASYLRPVWEALRDNSRKVRVLHIGDSHLQGEVQGREIRKRLYALWGNGGRGYVFPFAIAATSSAYDYAALGFGQWIWARSAQWTPSLPLGVTGMAIGTYDPQATWEIRWGPSYQPSASPGATLTLLTRALRPGLSLELTLNDTLSLPPQTIPTGYARLSYTLPVGLSALKGAFRWEGEDSLFYAELHGIFIEEGAKGITWYSMGVNGARLSDWARLPLLKESLRLLQPDLIVIDLGTNDLYAAESRLPDFRQSVEAAIDTIRAVYPQAAILVTTPQDFYRRMRPIPALAQASQLIRWIAAQKKVAVWDGYTVLGSMREWRLAGLALPDMVHLTGAGYALKGQMLVGAFLRSYADFLRDSLPDPAVEARAIPPLAESLLVAPAPPVPLTPSLSQIGSSSPAVTYAPPRPTYLYHKVKPGETLGQIAQKYRVSVRSIQQANGLRGSFIRAGQTLRIPTRAGIGAPAPSSTASKSASSVRYHTVRPGDSLWGIAQAYGVSIEALCKANQLTPRSAIHPGQRLRIP